MAKYIQFGGELIRALELANGGLAFVGASDFQQKTVTIGTAAAESSELDCGEGMRLVGYEVGTPCVTTSFTFKGGSSAGVRKSLYNSAGAVTHTVTHNVAVGIGSDIGAFYPYRYISFVAGTVQGGTALTITANLASI